MVLVKVPRVDVALLLKEKKEVVKSSKNLVKNVSKIKKVPVKKVVKKLVKKKFIKKKRD